MMLNVENLHAEIDGKEILKGLTLKVPAGEVHAIMGPNGAGKSTLSYVLTGRAGYEVTQGSATLDGEDLGSVPGGRWNASVEVAALLERLASVSVGPAAPGRSTTVRPRAASRGRSK